MKKNGWNDAIFIPTNGDNSISILRTVFYPPAKVHQKMDFFMGIVKGNTMNTTQEY